MFNFFQKQESNTIELLKWIAIITMVVDHIGIIIFKDVEFLRAIGRISLPLFGYILIHNYLFFSKNRKKYIYRLWSFAIISQPFFWFIIAEKINIFALLALVITVIYLSEKIESMDRKAIEKFITIFLLLFVSIVFSFFVDYGILGFLFLISIYLSFISYKYISVNLISTFFLNLGTYQYYTIIYYPVIYIVSKINIGIPRVNKWFFYSFYPIHLLILQYVFI